ncbi:hypothetical protein FACS1894211_00960 [Clostridia bacterium]|nr:hypothetical protein FACS1894211_00960 [Clostridia bacterium]
MKNMKNMEVTHTLRLYDADFIARLGTLMERERKYYRNKNEFMTVLLKLGYEKCIAAGQAAGRAAAPFTDAGAAAEKAAPFADRGEPADKSLKEVYPLLKELSDYLTSQFKAVSVSHALLQKLLSSVYRMMIAFVGGDRVMPQKVEDGFFDDLPARFEKIVVNLETRFGLKT